MSLTEKDFGNFKIVLNEKNELTDILYNNKSVELPTAFCANADFNCDGNTVLTISCLASNVEIFK